MKNIAIFGAGGLGKETVCFLDQLNKIGAEWNFIGFYDDGVEKGTQISHYGAVLGGMNEINTLTERIALVIAIGNPISLKRVKERITNKHIYFPNIISPTFGIADEMTFSIGEGNIIGGHSWASCDVKIGNFNIFNGETILSHDVTIGDYNVIMPDVHISGEVSIGCGNLLGVGSIVLQQIKIGNNVTLGAGSVLLTKPKDGCTYIGNPAKLFKY